MGPKELTPVSTTPPSIRFGNVKGNHFYNALRFKRVKGKFKVRGEHANHYLSFSEGFSPAQGQEMKVQEKKKQHEKDLKALSK